MSEQLTPPGHTIYLVDDSAICREGTADILRREGFTVIAFASAEDTQRAMALNPKVDLLLLDLVLPEMDGLSLLEKLRHNSNWAKLPVLMLTGSEKREDVVRAAKLDIKGFILKSQFSVELLLNHVNGILNPPPAAPAAESASTAPVKEEKQVAMLSRTETKGRAEKFLKDKTLSGSVAEVLSLTSSPQADLMDLIRVVKRDVLLSTRVLQVANSAAYASAAASIDTIEDAVRNIGLKSVRNIAVSVGVFEKFPPSSKDGFNLINYWRHSFAVAMIMDKLLPVSNVAPGIGYVVGLCHDLAEMTLQQSLTEEYDSALHAADCNGETFENVKAAVFGMLPHELNALVLSKMGIPATIQAPILEYHKLSTGSSASLMMPVTKALRLADSLANGMMLANTPYSSIAPVTAIECRDSLGTASPILMEFFSVRAGVLAQTSLLARLSVEDESRLSGPMVPSANLHIGYIRHANLSSFDPLQCALELLGTVELRDDIPSAVGVSEKWDVIVMAVPESEPPVYGIREIGRFRKIEPRTLPLVYLKESAVSPLVSQIPGVHVLKLPVTLNTLSQLLSQFSTTAKPESAEAA